MMHATTGQPETWVPVTDEIFDNLYARYMHWIDNLSEIRQRMAELRDAVEAGWKPDPQSQSNLDRLNANDEWNAHHNIDNARTVLLCAEFQARSFLPGDRAQEIALATLKLIAEKNRPCPEAMAKFADDMRAGRVPMPSGYEESTSQFKPRLGPTLLGRKRK